VTGAPAGFTFRRGRPADAAAVARVMSAAVRGRVRARLPARTLQTWASLPPLYHRWAMTAGGETYLVAERTGQMAGYAAVRGAELTALFVHPRFAGRSLGAALVERARRLARRRGVRTLHAAAAPGALPFYAGLGFRPGRAVRVPLPGGRVLRAVRVHLSLQVPRW